MKEENTKCQCGISYSEDGKTVSYPEELYQQFKHRLVQDIGVFQKEGGGFITSTNLVLRYWSQS